MKKYLEKVKKVVATTLTVLIGFQSFFIATPILASSGEVISFNFNDENVLVDSASEQNQGVMFSWEGVEAIEYSNGPAGGQDSALSADHWDTGDYWEVSLNTTGYSGFSLSSRQRSSSAGPQDFSIVYKVGDSSWSTLTSYQITNDSWNNGSNVSSLVLPDAVNDKTDVVIRWIVTSNLRATATPTKLYIDESGTNRIDNVKITGTPIVVVDNDQDDDGVEDEIDNCPSVPNPNQENADGDSAGDACDLDWDEDGVLNDDDNCPLLSNPEQTDTDGDLMGDACDSDDDNDDVADGSDNCPLVNNPDQTDVDENGLGDVCDPDADADGIIDGLDNCPLVANPQQEDFDEDGIGDVCDEDIDGDGKLNDQDNCPLVVNNTQTDSDRDGIGNDCDPIPYSTLTVTVDNQSIVYGQTDPAFTFTISGFLDGDNEGTLGELPICSVVGEYKAVGAYPIVCSGIDENYVFDFLSATLTVTPLPITVTAETKTKTVGLADPVLTYKVTTGVLLPGDFLTGSLNRQAGEGVGSYQILQGNLGNSNYAITFVSSSLTITANTEASVSPNTPTSSTGTEQTPTTNQNPTSGAQNLTADQEKTVTTDESEKPATEGEVKGATDTENNKNEEKPACNWWWILLLLLGFSQLPYYHKLLKMEKLPKYWIALPIVVGAVAYVAHSVLSANTAPTVFCRYFWAFDSGVLMTGVFGFLSFERRKKKSKIFSK